MKTEFNKPQKLDVACPLGELGEALHQASNFYRRREENAPDYRQRTAWDTPEMAAFRKLIKKACDDDKVDQVSVSGVCFNKLPMPPVTWQSVPKTPDPYGGNRSHYHTTFVLDSHEIHVDSICRSSSGPGSGVREFQFFIDGEFASRGGHAFTVPARIPRGEPAGLAWNDYLVICERKFRDWDIPRASWFTLWKK